MLLRSSLLFLAGLLTACGSSSSAGTTTGTGAERLVGLWEATETSGSETVRARYWFTADHGWGRAVRFTSGTSNTNACDGPDTSTSDYTADATTLTLRSKGGETLSYGYSLDADTLKITPAMTAGNAKLGVWTRIDGDVAERTCSTAFDP